LAALIELAHQQEFSREMMMGISRIIEIVYVVLQLLDKLGMSFAQLVA
jgi:hypothetical protein